MWRLNFANSCLAAEVMAVPLTSRVPMLQTLSTAFLHRLIGSDAIVRSILSANLQFMGSLFPVAAAALETVGSPAVSYQLLAEVLQLVYAACLSVPDPVWEIAGNFRAAFQTNLHACASLPTPVNRLAVNIILVVPIHWLATMDEESSRDIIRMTTQLADDLLPGEVVSPAVRTDLVATLQVGCRLCTGNPRLCAEWREKLFLEPSSDGTRPFVLRHAMQSFDDHVKTASEELAWVVFNGEAGELVGALGIGLCAGLLQAKGLLAVPDATTRGAIPELRSRHDPKFDVD